MVGGVVVEIDGGVGLVIGNGVGLVVGGVVGLVVGIGVVGIGDGDKCWL